MIYSFVARAQISSSFLNGVSLSDLHRLWEQQGFDPKINKQQECVPNLLPGTPRKRSLRPVRCWDRQLRMGPTSASDPADTMNELRLGAARCEPKSQESATQGSARRRVGPCRHTRRRIFSMATRPGFCYVLPWLDSSELRRIQVACTQLPDYTHSDSGWMQPAVSMYCCRAASRWSTQLREARAGATDSADTVSSGRLQPSVSENRRAEAGNSGRRRQARQALTHQIRTAQTSGAKHTHSHQSPAIPTSSQLERAASHISLWWEDNSSPRSVSPQTWLQSSRPRQSHGRWTQRQTSPGPLVPYPDSVLGPDILEERYLLGSIDGAAGLGRLLPNRWPGPEASEINNDHQISPTQPCRHGSKQPRRQSTPHSEAAAATRLQAEQRRETSLRKIDSPTTRSHSST